MSSESRWIWHFGHPPPGPMTETEDVLGGKGAALSRMTIAGLPVPPGFSISTEACRVYWASSRRLPDSLCNQLQEAVAQIESKTGSRYGVGPQPLLLAVRSGAKQSMPGMMATLLNCGMTRSLVESHDQSHALADAFAKFIADFARVKLGLDVAETEPSQRPNWQRYLQRYEQTVGEAFPDEPWRQLELAVGMVFDSWNSQRTVQYRALRGIRDVAGTAVNVQAMVPAQRSGLLFSQDPLKRKRNTWVVEVVSGLGDQLAAGQQTPQRFFVSRDARAEADRVAMDCGQPASLAIPARREPRPPEPAAAIDPLLSVDQLVELSELGRVLEREFGCSVDVEWGLHDDRFVLFQSRPQETNEVASRQDACIDHELARLRNAANEGGVWVRHNLAESVPAQLR